jgi:hypothetical protein
MNPDQDYGNQFIPDFGPINQGTGNSSPVGGSEQCGCIVLCGTPAARARVAAALNLLFQDEYASSLLHQFVKRIDCVQLPDKLSRRADGYPFQAIDPRHSARIAAAHIFQNSFYNGGWGRSSQTVIQEEIRKLEARMNGRGKSVAKTPHYSQPSLQSNDSEVWTSTDDFLRIPERFERQITDTLQLIARCTNWLTLANTVSKIEYADRMTFDCQATHPNREKSMIYLGKQFFRLSTENAAFILLKQLHYCLLRSRGMAYQGGSTEQAGDIFAHNILKESGYNYNYESNSSPGLWRQSVKEERPTADTTSPAINVPEQYRQGLDEALSLLCKCFSWAEFCRLVGSIDYNPNAKIFRQQPNAPAYNQLQSFKKSEINLNTSFFAFSAIDKVFALLHEYHHAMLWSQNRTTANLAEEHACDLFAHNAIKRAGYKHTYRSGYNTPGVNAA